MELLKISRRISLTLGIFSLCISVSRTDYCPPARVGQPGCTQACPSHCKDQSCHPINGNCLACNPGYVGPNCQQECSTGKYGDKCAKECPNCFNRTCHIVNGSCKNGCEIGYEGDQCTVCKSSTYGKNCSENCSNTCLKKTCHHVSGNCSSGCQNGYQGVKCEQFCNAGSYGAGCTQTCPVTCPDGLCTADTGHCLSCQPGYQGLKCEEFCPANTFGPNCSNICSRHCLNVSLPETTCHHMTGACLQGCQEGYEGYQCVNNLDTGRFILNTALLINLVFGLIILLALLAFLARYYKVHPRRFLRPKKNSSASGDFYSAPSFSSRKSDPSYAPFNVQGNANIYTNKEDDKLGPEDTEAADHDLIYENTMQGQEAKLTNGEEGIPDDEKQTSAEDEKVYANFLSIKDQP